MIFNLPRNFTGIVEWPSGTKYWYQNGNLHRKDGPAVIYSSGTKEWWQNGKLHRENGPVIDPPSGTKEWCQNGKFTQYVRIDDLAPKHFNNNKHCNFNDRNDTSPSREDLNLRNVASLINDPNKGEIEILINTLNVRLEAQQQEHINLVNQLRERIKTQEQELGRARRLIKRLLEKFS